MNILFGMIPAMLLIGLLLWARIVGLIKTKTLIGTTLTVLFLAGLYSFQTYGPRAELANTVIPEPPEKVEVESGKKLVDHKDRSKTFTDQIGR